MPRNEYVQLETPEVSAIFPKVNHTFDVFQGKERGYVVKAVFDKEFTDSLIKQIDNEFNNAVEFVTDKKTNKHIKWSKDPVLPYNTLENGDVEFSFRTRHKDNKGNRVYVPVVDAEGNSCDVKIVHGARIVINYTPRAWHITDRNNGVTLYLNGIQVIDPKLSASREVKFTKKSGWVASEQPTDSFVPEDDEPDDI